VSERCCHLAIPMVGIVILVETTRLRTSLGDDHLSGPLLVLCCTHLSHSMVLPITAPPGLSPFAEKRENIDQNHLLCAAGVYGVAAAVGRPVNPFKHTPPRKVFGDFFGRNPPPAKEPPFLSPLPEPVLFGKVL
jgi:hypothetical protein